MTGSSSEMVKIKAELSLEEWLAQGVANTEVNCTKGVVTEVECPSTQRLLVPGISTEVASTSDTVGQNPTKVEVKAELDVNPDTPVTAAVVDMEDKAAKWFWSLLEQSGYERW